MKMFVPLFVGLYASHLSFSVLETLWVYRELELENVSSTTFGKTR